MVFTYAKENIKYNEVNCKNGSTFLYSCSLHCPLLYPAFGKVTSLNVSLHIIMNFILFYNLLTPGFLDVLICLHIHNASYISVFLSGIEFSFILTESDWKPKRAGDVTSGLVSELATTLLKTQTEITYCSVLWKNKLRVETKLSFWDLLMKSLEKDKRTRFMTAPLYLQSFHVYLIRKPQNVYHDLEHSWLQVSFHHCMNRLNKIKCKVPITFPSFWMESLHSFILFNFF